MNTQDVTLPLPEALYLRLKQTAKATQQSLTDVLLHAVQVEVRQTGKMRRLRFRLISPLSIA